MAIALGALAAVDDGPAIIEPGLGRLSYGELDALANRAASRLRQLGLGPGSRIAICLPRSADVIVAILGTLRAGAAFVPLDPAAPVERNAGIVADCGVQLVLVEARTCFETAADVHVLEGVGLGRAIAAWAGDASPSVVDHDPESLASVMYTSGSTGRPKGAMMTRHALETFAAWIRTAIGPTRADTFASHASFHFAMSTFDILGALTSGAALVIVPETARANAERVAEVIERERVTIWFSGPAILTQIAKLVLASRLASLRVLAFAGEVFPVSHLRELRRQLPGPRYLHIWGSTETNVGVVHELPAGDVDVPPPIGTPCDHFEYRIVDTAGVLVAPGTPGELVVRGPAVHAGYANQPEMTAEKRFIDPEGGAPWHRTGDLVIELPTGELKYAGRLGRMVKIRGYRVEPGEVEARLYEHPRVVEAGVVPEGTDGELELVAHLRTLDDQRLTMVELKQFCAKRLPPYMIPRRFVFHVALPRTANGKIDLRRLAESSP
ncbi:MAG TPA: amino acid adenylation domain-containing protein [Kofleriaceae bacterium]